MKYLILGLLKILIFFGSRIVFTILTIETQTLQAKFPIKGTNLNLSYSIV